MLLTRGYSIHQTQIGRQSTQHREALKIGIVIEIKQIELEIKKKVGKEK